MNDVLTVLTVTSAIGSGLIGGVMFAFSTSVMPGLAKRPAPQAITAMQAMNIAILNPLFLLLFSGTALACATTAVLTLFADEPGTPWRIAGALLYVIGVFGVTGAVNVPMNNRVDALDPDIPASAEVWKQYLTRWTAFNHVRVVAAAAAAAALTVALLR